MKRGKFAKKLRLLLLFYLKNYFIFQRRQEMLQNFQKKKDCEERAHAIVERLLEGNESIDWIRKSV